MNESPTIVVVDNDQDTLDFMCAFFGMQGMVVVPCPTGQEATGCIMQHRPTVVILDVHLEGITGVEVLRELRAEPTTQMTPIVFFTGSGDELRRLLPDFAAHGAALVAKPDVEKLSTLVQRVARQSA